jgi:septation ring formation regulator EzrA
MIDTEKIEELADLLQYASKKAEIASEQLKDIKELEISAKEATEQLKRQSENLEKKIAEVVAEKVLTNLSPFFANSKRIRESAEAIHQANIKIQQVYLKTQNSSSKILIIITSILSFIAGAATVYFFAK